MVWLMFCWLASRMSTTVCRFCKVGPICASFSATNALSWVESRCVLTSSSEIDC